jgi:hypothetical protein
MAPIGSLSASADMEGGTQITSAQRQKALERDEAAEPPGADAGSVWDGYHAQCHFRSRGTSASRTPNRAAADAGNEQLRAVGAATLQGLARASAERDVLMPFRELGGITPRPPRLLYCGSSPRIWPKRLGRFWG